MFPTKIQRHQEFKTLDIFSNLFPIFFNTLINNWKLSESFTICLRMDSRMWKPMWSAEVMNSGLTMNWNDCSHTTLFETNLMTVTRLRHVCSNIWHMKSLNVAMFLQFAVDTNNEWKYWHAFNDNQHIISKFFKIISCLFWTPSLICVAKFWNNTVNMNSLMEHWDSFGFPFLFNSTEKLYTHFKR